MMGYLLDTNVISEMRRPRIDPNVSHFLKSLDPRTIFVSAMTLGELRKGARAVLQRDAAKARDLSAWIDGIERSYPDRILPIDQAVARRWGELSADRPLPVVDTLIAATALVHSLTLVTRNLRDVASTGVAVVDPWQPV